jgi:hypothetical protein
MNHLFEVMFSIKPEMTNNDRDGFVGFSVMEASKSWERRDQLMFLFVTIYHLNFRQMVVQISPEGMN